MKGGKSARWIDENMADTFLEKSVRFLEENREKPFFLYYALHQPHVPRVPHQRFVGKSGMGPRGNAILEADWCVQEFLSELDRLDLASNTIVIFSSDNGPVLNDGYWDQAEELKGKHKPAGILRGGKASLFEGGTRVPFIIRWPEKIKHGKSEAIVCQIDFLASFAKLLNRPREKKYDSKNLMKAFLGETK
jgi:arylsulfatase A-like enzyme